MDLSNRWYKKEAEWGLRRTVFSTQEDPQIAEKQALPNEEDSNRIGFETQQAFQLASIAVSVPPTSATLNDQSQTKNARVSQVQKDAESLAKCFPKDSPTKFFYAKRNKLNEVQTIRFADINLSDFLTISRYGFTDFKKGKATFWTLKEWETEQLILDKLSNLSLFKQYLLWKTFKQWKIRVGTSRFNSLQERLCRSYFSLDDELRETLYNSRSNCIAIESRDIFQVEREQFFTLENWVAAQKRLQTETKEAASDLWGVLRQQVSSCCQDYMQTAAQHFEVHNPVESGFTKTKNAKAISALLKSFKSEAYQDAKDPQDTSKHRMALHRVECRLRRKKLFRFVRLVQHMFVDSIVNMLRLSSEKLSLALESLRGNDDCIVVEEETDIYLHLEKFQFNTSSIEALLPYKRSKESSTSSPLLQVALKADSTNVKVEPSCETILDHLENLQEEALKFFSSMGTLFELRETSALLRQASDNEAAEEIPAFKKIADDEKVLENFIRIRHLLTESCEKAARFAKNFEPLLQVVDSYSNIKIDHFENFTIEDINNYLSALKDLEKQIQKIEPAALIGAFFVDVIPLKKFLLPIPEQKIDVLVSYLPKLAKQKSEDLTSTLKELRRKLKELPLNIEQHMNYVNLVDDAVEKSEHFETQYWYMTNLFEIMGRNGIPEDNDKFATLFLINQAFDAFRTELQLAREFIENHSMRFTKDLSEGISLILEETNSQLRVLEDPIFSNPESNAELILELLDTSENKIKDIQNNLEIYLTYQKVLKIIMVSTDSIQQLQSTFSSTKTLWSSCRSWADISTQWEKTKVKDLDVTDYTQKIQAFSKALVDVETRLPKNDVVLRLKNSVHTFLNALPVVKAISTEAFLAKHWNEVQRMIADNEFEPERLTIEKLLSANVLMHTKEILAISSKAVSEKMVGETLEKLKKTWDELQFIFLSYKTFKDVFILGSVEEIVTAIDESLITVNSVAGSENSSVEASEKLENWQKILVLFQDIVEEWLQAQGTWIHLEGIFSSGDISKQIPNGVKQFQAVNTAWKSYMQKAKELPTALESAGTKDNLIQLKELNGAMQSIQKSLDEYLSAKRQDFPRFYFLSDEELLEILSNSRDPHAVQPHLQKCFDGLCHLSFVESSKLVEVVAMRSAEGEAVTFSRAFKARGPVEKWLPFVEDSMIKTIKDSIKQCYKQYAEVPLHRSIYDSPAQVISSVTKIEWCYQVEQALLGTDVPQELQQLLAKNAAVIAELVKCIQGELTDVQRRSVMALAVQEVHNRGIIEMLKDSKVTSIDSFQWQSQLKYYWTSEESSCVLKQMDAEFAYGYEYLGAVSRLVITPLTERCWMTVTGALHYKLGVCAIGPAGTGKTESIKDLAKAMGRQCIVYNCSDQLEYGIIEKLFAGIVATGAWACLDEFNRIDEEVLSVISQKLQSIHKALMGTKSEVDLGSCRINVRPTCGIFATMNAGYAGRTELPDNLKIFLRPVSMIVPDFELIAENTLLAEGFKNSRHFAQKFVALASLCELQLSRQLHYDFGLRSIKAMLTLAGKYKRKNPSLSEEAAVIQAACDWNIPKLVKGEKAIFEGIINDLFNGAHNRTVEDATLKNALRNYFKQNGYQTLNALVEKSLQLYETLQIRVGVALLGSPMSGKSVALNALIDALNYLAQDSDSTEKYQHVNKKILNPKSITIDEMYGNFNERTKEWQDGLLSKMVRNFANEKTEEHKWIILDGPVDALWIESMNSVLDDSKVLCIASGERIKIHSQMRMLFEVADLFAASPATISRFGMIYFNEDTLNWRHCARSWIEWQVSPFIAAQSTEKLWEYFETYVDDGLIFIKENCKTYMEITEITKVQCLCTMLEGLLGSKKERTLSTLDESSGPTVSIDFEALTPKEIDARMLSAFALAFVWGLGSAIDAPSRTKFSLYCKKQLEIVRWPRTESVYDVMFDLGKNRFISWDDIAQAFEAKPELPLEDVFVPTKDLVKHLFFLSNSLSCNRPALLTGSPGNGKTFGIKQLLTKWKKAKQIHPVQLLFSRNTDCYKTQLSIEKQLEKKHKRMLGGVENRRVILSIDDVNLVKIDGCCTQPPIELIRQLEEQKGFYDREKHYWKQVDSCSLLLNCGVPGGGRNPIAPRFLRHCYVLSMPDIPQRALSQIFSFLTTNFLNRQNFTKSIGNLTKALIEPTIDIYNRAAAHFVPTPATPHYSFSFRQIKEVFEGVFMAHISSFSSEQSLLRLWLHEVNRVFGDRISQKKESEWFSNLLGDVLSKRFDAHVTDSGYSSETAHWGSFIGGEGGKSYRELPSLQKVEKFLESSLQSYNVASANPVSLVFFKDAIEHISRASRVLTKPTGNLLLIGLPGSGKRTSALLASYISGIEIGELNVVKDYNLASFREDLKRVLLKVGLTEGRPYAFLVSEEKITEEFLENLNSLLNSGEVPHIFNSEDEELIYNDSLKVAPREDIDSYAAALSEFSKRVKERLRVILCLSPAGESLRKWLSCYPSLSACSTIDWYKKWPQEALVRVAAKCIAGLEMSSSEADGFINFARQAYKSVLSLSAEYLSEYKRHVYVTPKKYMESIQCYVKIYSERVASVSKEYQSLTNGLERFKQVLASIKGLREDLGKLEPVLHQKQVEASELVQKLMLDQHEADAEKERIKIEGAAVKVQADNIAVLQREAQRHFDTVLPAWEAAVAALDALNKSDITEIKSFVKPPVLVSITMEAVNTLLEEKVDWDSAKRVLGETGFLQRLKNYDRDHIPAATLKRLDRYLMRPDFSPESVGTHSLAAKSLCMWVHAIRNYSKVFKAVEVKRNRLKEMNEQLSAENAKLFEAQKKLNEALETIQKLEAQLKTTNEEKQRLEVEAEQCRNRILRAEQIVQGLAEESVRWTANSDTLTLKLKNLKGDICLAAAYVSFLGPFAGSSRKRLLENWIRFIKQTALPFSENYSLENTLGDSLEIRDWNIQGLPSDEVSVTNALISQNCLTWPLLIDPQMQANQWIKAMESASGLKLLKLSDKNWEKVLEESMKFGFPVLIENIEEAIEYKLQSIMQQTAVLRETTSPEYSQESGGLNPQFRIYLTTKHANPHFLPQVTMSASIINFTVTFNGLKEQLLSKVVQIEMPETEKKNDRLVLEMAEDAKALVNLGNQLMDSLLKSKGNILDNVDLISTLGESKKLATELNKRLDDAKETAVEISKHRNSYEPVAMRAAALYFVVSSLSNLNPMYKFSLSYFNKIFCGTINALPKNTTVERRLPLLKEATTLAIHEHVSRALFERHKHPFSFLIACQILLRESGTVEEDEWNFLLSGVSSFSKVTLFPNPDEEIFDAKAWLYVCHAQSLLKRFEGLCSHITSNLQSWKDWMNSKVDCLSEFPLGYERAEKFTIFHRLLLLRGVRPVKFAEAAKRLTLHVLGQKFIAPPISSLVDTYNNSDCATPILLILSSGSDPTESVQHLASELGGKETNLKIVPLGKAQGAFAENLLEKAKQFGGWVLLQNCHLSKSWLPKLEKIVNSLTTEKNIHPAFRLILTSKPDERIPTQLVQSCIKQTTEPPSGIRSNMQKFLKDSYSMFDPSSKKNEGWNRLVFCLQMFHVVVRGRSQFGKLGWNESHEFNDTDIAMAYNILNSSAQHGKFIQWDKMEYVITRIVYGGRINDKCDLSCLQELYRTFLCPQILSPEYKFSPSGTYKTVEKYDTHSLSEYFETLPTQDSPEAFGLHESALVNFEKIEADSFFQTIKLLGTGREALEGKKEHDNPMHSIINTILSQLPDLIDTLALKAARDDEDVMRVFRENEIRSFNELITLIGSDLKVLASVASGTVAADSYRKDACKAILQNQIPEEWTEFAPSSKMTLAAWLDSLLKRQQFLENWAKESGVTAYNLSLISNPQGLLISILQQYGRQVNVPLDTISFEYEFLPFSDASKLKSKPSTGCYVEGLFFQGAKWDSELKCLQDCEAGNLYYKAPVIHFIPKNKSSTNSDCFACPLYKTANRGGTGSSSSLITFVNIPVIHAPSFWIKRGAAILAMFE